MRHRRLKRKIGVKSAHRTALLRNLVRSLVIHKRIRTTWAKAKEASAFADQMVTIAKEGNLAARRHLISRLGSPEAAHTLLTRVAPAFKERQGGYTRVLRLGFRNGDRAETALLEFTEIIEDPKKVASEKKKKRQELKGKESEKVKPAKEKEPGPETTEHPAKKLFGSKQEKAETKKEEKKESEKKGGFLGALRKFLTGSE